MSSPSNENGKRFRDALRFWRERRKLTQSELGARAGMAPAAISHFETGQRVPSIDSLVKLADALDVTVDLLLGREQLESASEIDPIFVRASRASSDVLDTVRRITAALLRETDSEKRNR